MPNVLEMLNPASLSKPSWSMSICRKAAFLVASRCASQQAKAFLNEARLGPPCGIRFAWMRRLARLQQAQ